MTARSRGGHAGKKSRRQEKEKCRMERWERREGRFMVAVMQKCKHFATFAENNDTAGRGRCARVRSVRFCVCARAPVWVGGCSNSTTGSGRRTTEVKRERERERNKEREGASERQAWQNWRYEIPIKRKLCKGRMRRCSTQVRKSALIGTVNAPSALD